jgi:hypothetical protein
MFLVILLYVLISFLSYVTSHKTEVYEVRSGSLSDNMVYQGIAIRRETVVNSDYTGTINYYNKEGERIQTGGLAFSVDESGKITDYQTAVELIHAGATRLGTRAGIDILKSMPGFCE